MHPKKTVVLVLAALLVMIFLQNTQVVSIRFLFWQLSMSRIIFLPLLLLFGFMVGYIVGKRSW